MINFNQTPSQSPASWGHACFVSCGCVSCLNMHRRLQGLIANLIARDYTLRFAQQELMGKARADRLLRSWSKS